MWFKVQTFKYRSTTHFPHDSREPKFFCIWEPTDSSPVFPGLSQHLQAIQHSNIRHHITFGGMPVSKVCNTEVLTSVGAEIYLACTVSSRPALRLIQRCIRCVMGEGVLTPWIKQHEREAMLPLPLYVHMAQYLCVTTLPHLYGLCS
jgi:hypothetical protein